MGMKDFEPWKTVNEKDDCIYKKPKERVKNERK